MPRIDIDSDRVTQENGKKYNLMITFFPVLNTKIACGNNN